MLGVVAGGRIGYVLFYDLPSYLAQPSEIFKIWNGGMSFHGGLLGVLLAGLWWSRREKKRFLDVVDFVAPLVPPVEVDAFIDHALMHNLNMLTIIHGKGTGILRNGIQQHLRRHKAVKSFRLGVYGEGESGVTIVELK